MLRQSMRACLAVILVLAATVALAAPARADRPMRLDDQITDRVDALGDRRGEAQAALQRLRDDTGVQLFVVFVRSFDGKPAQQWADETAVRSDLGERDALLAVATRDRSYAYNVDDQFQLTAAQLDEVGSVAIEPALAQNDWGGAVVGAADGLRAALAGEEVPRPRIVPGDPDPGSGGFGAIGVAAVCLVVLLVAGGVGFWLWRRYRRRQGAVDPNDPHPGVTTQHLSDRANTLLVELDDALRTSERELSMANTQYGSSATVSFSAALAAARQDAGEAFRLRMLLESEPSDGGPGSDESARRRILSDIIRLSERADERLDAESDAFDELREIEANVDESIRALSNRRSEIEPRLSAAVSELDTLRGRYVGDAVAAVSANPEQAKERLAFAESALAQASEDVTVDRRPAAALAVRAVQQALDQADTLLEAIARTKAQLDEAVQSVRSLLTEVETDQAAGRVALASGEGPGAAAPGTNAALAAALAGADQAAAAARAALEAPTMDPLATVRRLQEADAAVDRALAEVRDVAERTARARAMLDQAIQAAGAEISSATDFVTTRRGAVRERARTLLAEAQRHLSQAIALADTDPVAALAEVQEADRLAEQAGRSARSDVDMWGGPGGFAGPGSQRGMSDSMGGLAGAVLGGILIGGGRSRGGFGGGAFGGRGPGGFGGSGRRGGGGRF